MITGVSNHRMNMGELDNFERSRLDQYSSHLNTENLIIDDSAALTPVLLRAKAMRQKMLTGVDLIIVDYLQLMETGGRDDNDNSRVSKISRSLKMIAKDLDVPVIALSQLSREAEKRTGGRPKLSDLRDSGAIEQDADIVGFVYRPAVYLKGKELIDDEGNAITEHDGELIIAKHRNGALADIALRCYLKANRWYGRGENDNERNVYLKNEINQTEI
jgi:replicative DNA helicase